MTMTAMIRSARCPTTTDLWSLGSAHLPLRRDAQRILVAVASAGGNRVDREFEDADEFLIYEKAGHRTCFVGRQPCPRADARGDQERRTRLFADCDLVLCCNISATCRQTLSELGIDCNLDYAGERVSDAVSAL